MKNAKKLLLIVLALVLSFSTVLSLASCDEVAEVAEEAFEKIDEIDTKLDTKLEELSDAIDANKAELDAKITALEAEYKAKDDALLAEIAADKAELTELKTKYDADLAALNAADAANEAAITALNTEYTAKVAELNKADSDNKAAIEALSAEYTAKLVELNKADADNKAAIEALNKDYTDKVALLEKADADNKAELDALKAQYALDLKALQDKNEATDKAIADLDAKYAEEVAKLEASGKATAEELANLKTKYEADLKALQDADAANDKAIAELDAKYAEEVEKLEASGKATADELTALKAKYEADLKALQEADANNDKAIADLDTKYAEEVKALTQAGQATAEELANLKTKYEADLKALQDADAANDKAIADLDAKYAEEVEKLEANGKATAEELANIKTKYEADLKALQDADTANENSIKALENKYHAKVNSIEASIVATNSKIDANKAELEGEITSITNSYNKKISEIESLISEINSTDKSQDDKIAALEAKIAEMLSNHTHEFGEWILYTESGIINCENQLYYRFCYECNEISWKKASAGTHTWKTEYAFDDTHHWLVCKTCGAIGERLAHDPVVDKGYAATCLESGLTDGKSCSECKAVLEAKMPTDPLGHIDEDSNGECDRCNSSLTFNANGELFLFKGGVPTFRFVVGNDAVSKQIANIEELAELLTELSKDGSEINVVAQNAEAQEVEILIGTVTNRGDEYNINKYDYGMNGYAVKQIGSKIVVIGGSDSALDNAVNYLKQTVFEIKKNNAPFDDFVMASDKNYDVKQSNYTLKEITIAENSIKDYVITYPVGDTAARSCASELQNNLYSKCGIWLKVVSESNAEGKLKVAFRTIENDGVGDGFYVSVDKDGNLVIECEFYGRFVELAHEYFITNVFNKKNTCAIAADYSYSKNYRNIYYKDFGAKGDGVADDFFAIKAAHDFANEHLLNVYADPDAVYYIGNANGSQTITVKTNTYFNGCKFIFDDEVVSHDSAGRQVSIFTIASDSKAVSYNQSTSPIKSLEKGATNVGWAPGRTAMIVVYNSNVKQYIRYGANANSGDSQHELILIHADGNVDPSTPIQWTYETITKMMVYYIDDQPIEIRGEDDNGNRTTIITLYNDGPSAYWYYSRNIQITRSNVTLSGIEHVYESYVLYNNGGHGSPYYGFTQVQNCNNVMIDNMIYETPPSYRDEEPVLRPSSYTSPTGSGMGSYEMTAILANNITWSNSTQSNFFNADGSVSYGGNMGTNFCKNLTFDNMFNSSFDAHCGVYNATIKNSTVEHMNFIGDGLIKLENVTVYADANQAAINLREDYGATWAGDIEIDGLILKVAQKKNTNNLCIVKANWNNWNFGYTTYLPQHITMKNVLVAQYTYTLVGEGNGTSNRVEGDTYVYNALPVRVFPQKINDNCQDLSASTVNGVENKNPMVATKKIEFYPEYTGEYANLGITTPLNLIEPTGQFFKYLKYEVISEAEAPDEPEILGISGVYDIVDFYTGEKTGYTYTIDEATSTVTFNGNGETIVYSYTINEDNVLEFTLYGAPVFTLLASISLDEDGKIYSAYCKPGNGKYCTLVLVGGDEEDPNAAIKESFGGDYEFDGYTVSIYQNWSGEFKFNVYDDETWTFDDYYTYTVVDNGDGSYTLVLTAIENDTLGLADKTIIMIPNEYVKWLITIDGVQNDCDPLVDSFINTYPAFPVESAGAEISNIYVGDDEVTVICVYDSEFELVRYYACTITANTDNTITIIVTKVYMLDYETYEIVNGDDVYGLANATFTAKFDNGEWTVTLDGADTPED